jgi:hypothetical protein
VLVAVWLVGWLLAVRPSMRRTMMQQVCAKCEAHWSCDCREPSEWNGTDYRRGGKVRRATRGSLFERTGGDVAAAVWIAAWWPLWLTIVVLRVALRGLGAGVKTAVLRATPLTGPELERRIREQQVEIDRLSKEIGDASC